MSEGESEDERKLTHQGERKPETIGEEVSKSIDDLVRRERGEPDGFAVFWNAYPKKRKRGDAVKAFKQAGITAPILAEVLAALAVQAKSFDWTKDSRRWVPLPASWLRAEGWKDDLTTYHANDPTANSQRVDRNKGTFNEGNHLTKYAGLKCKVVGVAESPDVQRPAA